MITNKLKKIFFVAILGIIGYGAYTVYEYSTMSQSQKWMLENVEALTELEDGDRYLIKSCYHYFTTQTAPDMYFGCENHDGDYFVCGKQSAFKPNYQYPSGQCKLRVL